MLDWFPVPFLLCVCIRRTFTQVLSCWRKKVLSGFSNNETMITECGVAALGNDDRTSIPEDGSAEKSAVSLLDRVFLIVLVMVAIVVFLT